MPDYLLVLESLKAVADPTKASSMKAYMRDQFNYLGIQSPSMRQALNPLLMRHQNTDEIDWGFIDACWSDPHRELQYAALSYLSRNDHLLDKTHIPRIKQLIIQKSWWDTVDSIVHLVGTIVQKDPVLKALMIEWSLDENMWIRRTAIEHQLSLKMKTDTELLEVILVNNFGSKEFSSIRLSVGRCGIMRGLTLTGCAISSNAIARKWHLFPSVKAASTCEITPSRME